MGRMNVTVGILAVLAGMLVGCAPVIKDFDFPPDHRLHSKTVGVVYNRKGPAGSEGVDPYHLQEFLGALGTALGKHSRNARFVDLTGRSDVGPFPVVVRSDTGILGRVSSVEYAVLDTGAIGNLPDSVDILLMITGLSFMGGTPVDDTVGTKNVFGVPGFVPNPNFGVVPGEEAFIHSTDPRAAIGFPPTRSDDRGSADESTVFSFTLWDLKRNEALEFNLARLKQDRSFGGPTTTFAQDGERMGQILLRKLSAPQKNR